MKEFARFSLKTLIDDDDYKSHPVPPLAPTSLNSSTRSVFEYNCKLCYITLGINGRVAKSSPGWRLEDSLKRGIFTFHIGLYLRAAFVRVIRARLIKFFRRGPLSAMEKSGGKIE